jgi:hypothetical protein
MPLNRFCVACAFIATILLGCSPPRETTPLHAAAAKGEIGAVEQLVQDGADPNAVDEQGMTPLHLAAQNGHGATTEKLIALGANPSATSDAGQTPRELALANNHGGTAGVLERAGGAIALAAKPAGSVESEIQPVPTAVDAPAVQRLNPQLKYPDLASFEKTIGGLGIMLTSEHVYLFAPKRRTLGANVVFPYLVRAYDELKRITGVDTEYIMVVYNFPKGHEDAFGGTSNCTIWYDDSNLELDQHEEWRKHQVPHVSGYIEEMAHNFDAGLHAMFGWEMVGWNLGIQATKRVADNPIFEQDLASTRRGQAETYRRYVAAGFVFPQDIEPNQVDRIHAFILDQCEQKYGPNFWPDVFSEIRKRKDELRDAVSLSDGDAIRNRRYQITIECFDRLPGLGFKKLLEQSGISLTTDVKSLHPTEPGWNRRLS